MLTNAFKSREDPGAPTLDTRLGLENIKIRADTMYYVMPRLLKFHVKNGAARRFKRAKSRELPWAPPPPLLRRGFAKSLELRRAPEPHPHEASRWRARGVRAND